VPNETTLIVSLFLVSGAALVAFYIRQRRAQNPLYDLKAAARPTFWVAACAGLIVFGSLMGAMYIGQQFLQNVLGYSTVDAGLAILPAAAFMVLVAPRSAALVGALILGINFAAVPNETTLIVSLFLVSGAALVAFYIRQRRAENPLYDLKAAARPTFWVAACAGMIVFGSLMGAMYIGQQFLQNVLGYSTVDAGLAILPAAAFMVLVAPRSAALVERRGARETLLLGYVFVALGFLTMLLLWKEGISYWKVALGYSFVGIGVGFAGTPASHSLTSSVPVTRVGMASGTADLQRDLGGAIMQSLFGALLTAGYAAAAGSLIASSGKDVSSSTQAELTKSFSSAADTASRYPSSIQDQIIAGAKTAFLQGDQWAYTAGIVAVLLGATLVFFMFPKRDEERRLLARYQAEDTVPPREPPPEVVPTPAS